MKEPWQTFTIKNVMKMKDDLAQAQARIGELEGLVREMGKHIPLAISDRLGGWQAAKNELADILNRPEIKKIMEKTP